MKLRMARIAAVVAILAGPLAGAVPALAAPEPPGPHPVEIGEEVRDWAPTKGRLDLSPGALDEIPADAAAASTPITECTLGTKIWLILNNVTGQYQLSTFRLVAESSQTQIWVQNNLAWPAGDPRATPQIFCEQAEYMLGEFDSNIYPTEIDFFGPPDFHDGTGALLPSLVPPSLGITPDYYEDAQGRQVVLVSNIRDDNYFDSTYPVYIAGFYSSAFEAYFNRNVMSIDAFDWANRTGPSGTRPFLYEGVFAHEYQHLLHDDYDSDEENFINEGLSDLAEFLTGYGVATQSHVDAAAEKPENSLVAWGDQGDLEILTDYGLAYMYQFYLMESFGQSFIQALFHNTANGISGVNATLASEGTGVTFADTYHAFAPGLYTTGFFADDLLSDFQVNVGMPGKPNPEAYASTGAPPWGADYILLWGHERIANFRFNGYAFNPLDWTSDGSVLHSGEGDLLDNWAIFETAGGGSLTFDTIYQTEEDWDFGFVQVSTDGGQNWTSLSNAYTTSDHDPSAHPKVIANLPGLSGDSGGWINMSFDLSPYAGQNILVAFRYLTDRAVSEPGWYIDNVMVDGTLISDGSSTDAFQSLNEVLGISNDYTVLLIGERTRGARPEYEVQTVMSGGFASDWESIREMFDNYRQLVLVVIYDAAEGVTSYANYTYEIDHRGGSHLK
ncbi:MAG TPA: choice-of-anchor J domain-containing protein [Anaerolineales bacterium]|nr:choice-of-anchor J domain-containing protein [Anaerolineales bacterium]